MARNALDGLDRVHRRFAEDHNAWCARIEAISPASPDFAARVVAEWDRRNLAAKWRDVEDAIRRIALEAER